MIKLSNVNKYYNYKKDNQIHVIDNVSLELPSTGFVSFLGQSGSGKTTLLNVIGGLDKANGTITYDDLALVGYKMNKIDKYRKKNIGYVFQNYNLLLNETVSDNLLIALKMCGINNKEEQEKRIEYVLKAVGMFKYRKKKAYALSGGQQQRVSIARALVKSSKIIIADEPTGNLDKENAISVMNILKKVSKNTLVLMVTHNQELANFFSDQIFEIKDGAIVNQYQPGNENTLDTGDSNAIYLKDLKKEKISQDNQSICIYHGENHSGISLKIYEKNGTYYIDSDQNIKLLKDTNIKILDKHYETIKKDTKQEDNYDNSFFNDAVSKPNIFKVFANNIKESFHQMKAQSKKTKFLYVAFGLIGILISIMTILFTNFMVIDTSMYRVDKDYYVLSENSGWSSERTSEQLKKFIKENKIYDVSSSAYMGIDIKYDVNYHEHSKKALDVNGISAIGIKQDSLIKGSLPEKGQALLSQGIANLIVKNGKGIYENYDDIIGKKFDVGYSVLTISGIHKNDYKMIYLNDNDYIAQLENNAGIYRERIKRYKDREVYQGHSTYEIIEGRDFTDEDFNKDKMLAPINYPIDVGMFETINGKDYEVIGKYKFLYFDNNLDSNGFIYHEDYTEPTIISFNDFSYINKSIVLLSGHMPQAYDEVIASIYTNAKIGDKMGDKKVVGIYNGDEIAVNLGSLATRESFMIEKFHYYGDYYFKTNDINGLKKSIDPEVFSIKNAYDHQHDMDLEVQTNMLAIFGTAAGILLLISSILIYFLMRSKMISEIYNLGVYRSLGASRFKIYSRFVYDILVTISLTTLIGYFIGMLGYGLLVNSINTLLGMVVLKMSWPIMLLGILVIYVLGLIFGVLPSLLLMRKTPAEILSKYDI